jgi:hypothetical protein
MSMCKRLLTALLLKEIYWWKWVARVKFFLWLMLVLGVIGFGLYRLDQSGPVLVRLDDERLR